MNPLKSGFFIEHKLTVIAGKNYQVNNDSQYWAGLKYYSKIISALCSISFDNYNVELYFCNPEINTGFIQQHLGQVGEMPEWPKGTVC